MTLYETIFKRRSVRKYDMTPLDDATLSEIKAYVDSIDQMPGQPTVTIKLAAADMVKGSMAPHYLLGYCESSGAGYANMGFTLQKADLYLQSIGLGSLWLGTAKPAQKAENFCIMMAFGKTDVPPRGEDSDFKRLKLEDVSNADNPIARASRLAPSAMNSQPWKLSFAENRIMVDYVGRGAMQIILKGKLSKIDVGIVTRHIVEALQNEGKHVDSITPTKIDKLSVEIKYS